MLKKRLHMLVRVYTCQNATLLESSCRGSNSRYIDELKGVGRGIDAFDGRTDTKCKSPK